LEERVGFVVWYFGTEEGSEEGIEEEELHGIRVRHYN